MSGAPALCVPNVYDGRDSSLIDRLVAAVAGTPRVRVLDVHSDPDCNRSVLTSAGQPPDLVDAAFYLAGG